MADGRVNNRVDYFGDPAKTGRVLDTDRSDLMGDYVDGDYVDDDDVIQEALDTITSIEKKVKAGGIDIGEFEAVEAQGHARARSTALEKLERANALGTPLPASQRVDKLISELWHTGMALSVIAHWPMWRLPILRRHHPYIISWVLRTAQILVDFDKSALAADMVVCHGRTHKEVEVLTKARSIIMHHQSDISYIRKRLAELEITS